MNKKRQITTLMYILFVASCLCRNNHHLLYYFQYVIVTLTVSFRSIPLKHIRVLCLIYYKETSSSIKIILLL